ncbi:MAG: hypothetical protein ABL308_12365 [Oceanicaulis sp.]
MPILTAAALLTMQAAQPTPAPDVEDYQRQTMIKARCREYTADTDADGVVDFDEYTAYREETFHGWDLDASDDLSLMEAETCWVVRGGERETAPFRDFDLNDDRIIGYEEYHPEGWWEQADADADGVLEPEEWPEAFQD